MPANRDIEKDWLRMLQATDLSRSLAEQERTHRAEMRRILLDFLEILDSLDRLKTPGTPVKSENLEALRRQLLGMFERAGVVFFESVGHPFDPQKQVAAETRSDPALEPGTVVEELRRGCIWQGDLLRPAQVVVTKDRKDQEE